MSQIKAGLVSVTNGSPTVVGDDDCDWGDVQSAHIFSIQGSDIWYSIQSAQFVTDHWELTLAANYAGGTGAGKAYAITTSFTPNLGIAYPERGDVETASLFKRAMLDVDNLLSGGQLKADTRRSVAVLDDPAVGDVYGIEQVSAAQSGDADALRLFTSSQGSAYLAFGKYTSATAFSEYARFDSAGVFRANAVTAYSGADLALSGAAVRVPTGTLVVGANAYSGPTLDVNGAAATTRGIRLQTAGVNRWRVQASADAESTANAGSNFEVIARADDGTAIDTPLTIVRAAGGSVTLTRPLVGTSASFSSIAISGAGATSFVGPINVNTGGTGVAVTLGNGTNADHYITLRGSTGAMIGYQAAATQIQAGQGKSIDFYGEATGWNTGGTLYARFSSTTGSLGFGGSAASAQVHLTNSITQTGASIHGLRVSSFLRPTSATAGTLITVDGTVDSNSGNLTSATGLDLQVTTSSANTVTDCFGVRIKSFAGAALNTNRYALKIENVTGGTSTNYAIYTGSGIVLFGGQLQNSDGSAAAPSITLSSSATTGFYYHSANRMGFASAGSMSISIYSGGSIYGQQGSNRIQLGGSGEILLECAGTNQNVTITPSGTGRTIIAGSSGNLQFGTANAWNIVGNSNGSLSIGGNTSGQVTIGYAAPANSLNVATTTGNILIGTAVDGTGKLQLAAGTTSASGISLGGEFLYQKASGSIETLSHFGVQAGSGGAPGLYFTNDSDTGIYSPNSNQVAITVGSATAVTFDSTKDATFAGGIIQGSVAAAGGYQLYNTVDQTTDYERLRIFFTGNVATIAGQQGGAGTHRNLAIKPSNGGTLTMTNNSADAAGVFKFAGLSTALAGQIFYAFSGCTHTGTSGSQAIVSITPTYNQLSGTAGNTDLLVNRTETAIGSGNQRLIDLQVGAVSRFYVRNDGVAFCGIGGTGSDTAEFWINSANTGSTETRLVLGRNSSAQVRLLHNGSNTYFETGGGLIFRASVNGATVATLFDNETGFTLTGSTRAQTSGTVCAVRITPTYNQLTGSAANTDLLVNRTETALGSGAQNFVDFQVAGTSKLRVNNIGTIIGNGVLTLSDGSTSFAVATGFFGNANTNRAAMSGGVPSSTVPGFTRRDDSDTGLGLGGSNDAYIITAGVAAVSVDSSQNTTLAGTLTFSATSTISGASGNNMTVNSVGGGDLILNAASGRTTYFKNGGTIVFSMGSTSTLTGGAGNMTIVAGTGNSRTLTLQTTTSGGVATDALVIDATQRHTITSSDRLLNLNTTSSDVVMTFQKAGVQKYEIGVNSANTLYFRVANSGTAALTFDVSHNPTFNPGASGLVIDHATDVILDLRLAATTKLLLEAQGTTSYVWGRTGQSLNLGANNVRHLFLNSGTGEVAGGGTTGTLLMQAITAGSASAPTYSFEGDNNTGIYRIAADIMGFATAGAEGMRLDSTNLSVVGTVSAAAVTSSGDVRAGAGALIGFSTTSTRFRAPSDGVLTISNAAETSFSRVQFGGTTASFPAIKRNAAAINFRLADDSADAAITAGAATLSGDLSLSAGNIFVVGGTGSIGTTNRGSFTWPADGVLLIRDNAGTSFGRFQFGGTTASFPSIKRSSAGIAVRLADDSADAAITAAAGTFSGTLTTSGGRVVATNSQSGSYTLTTSDYDVFYTGTGGHTFTLIAASSNSGRRFWIKNVGSGTLTVDFTALGQVFKAALLNTLTLGIGDAVELSSNGTNWAVL